MANNAIRGAIFDMDGVITRTSHLHAMAWKKTFDDFLYSRTRGKLPYQPFDIVTDYHAYVDGKPRMEGVRSFLRARQITLTPKEEEDLAREKEALFESLSREQGIEVYPSTIALIHTLRSNGVKIAVVTSSRHGRDILQHAGITDLFDARLDGIDLDEKKLAGKPAPDMFVQAAQALDVDPRHAMVVEDAVAGVQAGCNGGFGLVVGIDRGDNATALKNAGADMVISDLAETSIEALYAACHARQKEIAWHIEQEGFDLARERQMESLFAIGNGYMSVRGALEIPVPGSQGDLFIAGIYDRKYAELPYPEIDFIAAEHGADPYTELVPFPFPFYLKISIGGTSLGFSNLEGNKMRRVLDMRHGIMHVETSIAGRKDESFVLRTRRCASLSDPHLLLQEAEIASGEREGKLKVDCFSEVAELQTRYPHLECIEHMTMADLELACYATRGSRFRICIASRCFHEPNILRRLLVVFTSRDEVDPRAAAIAHVQNFEAKDFADLFLTHAGRWKDYWKRADVLIPGHPEVEQALRFGAYHLRLPASKDVRISIGARALTGRAYAGHVFWDTEIFMLPFFLHVDPSVARNLLLYRHYTLEGARRRARSLGFHGACYAWESTVTGDDATPDKIILKSTDKEIPIFNGQQQIHVTADVAYAVWRYWEMTKDEAFLAGPGAEILFETARFWASRVTRDNRHYHIRGVVGPDEYHYGVDDNAYTNWMARFNLDRAAWLAATMGVNTAEADEWTAVAQSLYIPMPNERGIIEQFTGFFSLEDYALHEEERFAPPVSRLFDWEKINRLKIIKQADVLMLPLLFPEKFTDEAVKENYLYYEPLTDHGSSLSPSVHAAIAARIGMSEAAERYWKQSLWLDLSNSRNNSTLGIHPAAMGGTWQALVFGFLGATFSEKGPQLRAHAADHLPGGWNEVELSMTYRGGIYQVKAMRQ